MSDFPIEATAWPEPKDDDVCGENHLPPDAPAPSPALVIDLMAALKASLAAARNRPDESRRGKK